MKRGAGEGKGEQPEGEREERKSRGLSILWAIVMPYHKVSAQFKPGRDLSTRTQTQIPRSQPTMGGSEPAILKG